MSDANPDDVVATLESAISKAGDEIESGSNEEEWAGILADLTMEYGRLLETLEDSEGY